MRCDHCVLLTVNNSGHRRHRRRSGKAKQVAPNDSGGRRQNSADGEAHKRSYSNGIGGSLDLALQDILWTLPHIASYIQLEDRRRSAQHIASWPTHMDLHMQSFIAQTLVLHSLHAYIHTNDINNSRRSVALAADFFMQLRFDTLKSVDHTPTHADAPHSWSVQSRQLLVDLAGAGGDESIGGGWCLCCNWICCRYNYEISNITIDLIAVSTSIALICCAASYGGVYYCTIAALKIVTHTYWEADESIKVL